LSAGQGPIWRAAANGPLWLARPVGRAAERRERVIAHRGGRVGVGVGIERANGERWPTISLKARNCRAAAVLLGLPRAAEERLHLVAERYAAARAGTLAV
jgi:hypothetical protein